MILTFEITKDKDELEIFFDSEGYALLKNILKELEPHGGGGTEHDHMMTKEWGGNELTSEIMHEGNSLVNHVKLICINEA